MCVCISLPYVCNVCGRCCACIYASLFCMTVHSAKEWSINHNQWGRSHSPLMLSIALVICVGHEHKFPFLCWTTPLFANQPAKARRTQYIGLTLCSTWQLEWLHACARVPVAIYKFFVQIWCDSQRDSIRRYYYSGRHSFILQIFVPITFCEFYYAQISCLKVPVQSVLAIAISHGCIYRWRGKRHQL